MWHRRILLSTFVVILGLGKPSAAPRPQTGALTRTVCVTAVRDNGDAVPDLRFTDLRVKEDGKVKAVVNATRLEAPLTVVLMLDNGGLGLQSIRQGAAAFVSRLEGHAEIAILSTAGQNTVLSDYTKSTPTLISAINRLYARNTTGAHLLEGFVEAARTFTTREVGRPVIVSVAVEGPEFSSTRAEDVFAALSRTRAQLYVVRLGQPELQQSSPMAMQKGESLADESIQVNAVLGQGPARTGGRSEQLVQHSGIPKAMDRIAIELLSQYAVTYDGADRTAPDLKLEVETTRRGVKVRAPTHVGTGR